MFDGPEYEPYFALCLRLNLERKPEDWADGDFFASEFELHYGSSPTETQPTMIGPDNIEVFHQSYQNEYGPYERDKWAWLPRLDQWLEILISSGWLPWSCGLVVSVSRPGDRWQASIIDGPGDPAGEGATKEEALARLWMDLMDKRDVP